MDLSAKGDCFALGSRQSLIFDEVTGIRDIGQTQVWNPTTKQHTCGIDGARAARFNPTNDWLLVSDFEKGSLADWDAEKYERGHPFVNGPHPYDFAIGAEEKFPGVNEGNILIMDPGSGKALFQMDSSYAADGPAWHLGTTLSLSPNGGCRVSSVPDAPRGGMLFLWKIEE